MHHVPSKLGNPGPHVHQLPLLLTKLQQLASYKSWFVQIMVSTNQGTSVENEIAREHNMSRTADCEHQMVYAR